MATISQIRINKTPEISEILNFLKGQYYGLSESEIIKMILSKFYSYKNNTTTLHQTQYEELSPLAKDRYDDVENMPLSEWKNV